MAHRSESGVGSESHGDCLLDGRHAHPLVGGVL